MKQLAATLAAIVLTTPAWADERTATPDEPVKLTDAQLDGVVAGGALLDVNIPIDIALENINVSLSLSNVPVNVGAAIQVSALGQAIQSAQVMAVQQVTQVAR
ncbi:MAG: hypothetical protein ACJ79R_01320 [Anaeromyxobacteraceae bacterium]